MSPMSDISNISGRLLHPTKLLSSIVKLQSMSHTCISFTKSQSGSVISFYLIVLGSIFSFRECAVFLSFYTFSANKFHYFVWFS